MNEPDRTIEVSLRNPKGAVLGGTAVHTYTIMDSDPEPAVTFLTAGRQVKESAGSVTIGAELSAVSGWDVAVPLMVNGTARTPSNYRITPGPLVIKTGERRASVTVQVSANGLNEDDKTVVMSMGVPTHAVQGKVVTSTVTILNTDPEPAVTFTTASQQVKESAGSADIGVELSNLSGKDVVVPLMVSGTARTPSNYRITPGPLVIKAGERRASIPVQVSANGLNEDDKTVVMSMGVPANAVRGKVVTSAVTIVDTDLEPAVSFGSESSSGAETTSPVRLEVKLSAPSGKPVRVGYGVTGGTAVLGKDYALAAGVLSFEPGETTKTLVVDIKNHGIYDDDKTFEVGLQDTTNAVLRGTTIYSYSIININPAPEVAFTSQNQTLGKKRRNAIITIRLSGVSSKDVSVPFTMSGTAVDRKDYQVLTPSPVTIRAGMTTGAINIALTDNAGHEGTKTIVATLGTAVNTTPGKGISHTITMLAADTPPRIAIMPITNESGRKFAGEIMVSHFLTEIVKGKQFIVVEPGLIKEKMLDYRIVMYEGISITDATLLARELGADLVLSGRVLYYQEHTRFSNNPKVGFSLLLINRENQEVVWSSNSLNEGNDAVYLFDWGRISTVSRLSSEMAKAISSMIMRR
jgi:TolB-like protein